MLCALPRAVDQHEARERPMTRCQLRQDPQPFGDAVPRAKEIEHEPGSSRVRRAHEGDVEAGPLEFKRRGEAGDTGTDDQDAHQARNAAASVPSARSHDMPRTRPFLP
jgi:hypothetical protein